MAERWDRRREPLPAGRRDRYRADRKQLRREWGFSPRGWGPPAEPWRAPRRRHGLCGVLPPLPSCQPEGMKQLCQNLIRYSEQFVCVRVLNLEILCDYCSRRSAGRGKLSVRPGKPGAGMAKSARLASKGLLPTRVGADGTSHAPRPRLRSFLRGCTRRNHHPWDWKKRGKTRILSFANRALASPAPAPHVPGSAARRRSQVKCFA